MSHLSVRCISWLALLIAGALLLSAACDGDGEAPDAPTATSAPAGASPTGPSAPTNTPAGDATAVPQFDGTRGPVEGHPSGPGTALLADIRSAQHDEGFDRMVFEFSDAGLPNYTVEYVSSPVVGCGSGMPVEISGAALLQVRLLSTAAHDLETGEPTIESNELAPGLPTLIEMKSTCDFEGTVIWVAGLSAEVDFRVTELDAPPRIAVDVRHP